MFNFKYHVGNTPVFPKDQQLNTYLHQLMEPSSEKQSHVVYTGNCAWRVYTRRVANLRARADEQPTSLCLCRVTCVLLRFSVLGSPQTHSWRHKARVFPAAMW